jgi:hypothetical protein
MDALIPMLSVFMQSTCPELEEREQAAVNAHMAHGSEPPSRCFVDGRGPNEDPGPGYPQPGPPNVALSVKHGKLATATTVESRRSVGYAAAAKGREIVLVQ